MPIKEEILSNMGSLGMSLDQLVIKVVFAIALIIIGIAIAKLVKVGIRKLLDQIKIKEKTSSSFFELLIFVIQVSIWVLFLTLALNQLGIPQITNWLTNILIIIPAFVGGLFLLAAGFIVAVYLRSIVEDSDIIGWKALSMILFYFVIFITGVYAVKSALVSVDKQFANTLIIILTAIIGAGIAYYHVKNLNNQVHYKEIRK